VSVAVVGHVEFVEFLQVAHVPVAGEIVQVRGAFAEPAGGGGVAAVQLARLAGGATLFTALGDDANGRLALEGLERRGVRVHVAWRATPQRRANTFIDDEGERTIAVIGGRDEPSGADLLPWDELVDCDAVFVTAGDPAALRAARRARVLVATPRVGRALAQSEVALDALVFSSSDPGERYDPGDLHPEPRLVVATAGAAGGSYIDSAGRRGGWRASALPGPLVDTYGAGDSFAAGLTFGLGAGLEPDDAVRLAASCGAACVTGAGPYGARLDTAAIEAMLQRPGVQKP
jgi:ribokinase